MTTGGQTVAGGSEPAYTGHGNGYDVIFSNGRVVVIHDSLSSADEIILGFEE